MTPRMTRARFLSATLALGLMTPGLSSLIQAAPAGAPPAAETTMKKMMEAVKTKSFDNFMADTDDGMRAALTKQQFEGVSNQLAPRLKQGYRTTYLSKLRQEGHDVFLWKLEITDAKDDHLIKLSLKDGKVAAFLIN
jgi:hypothetical protein